MSDFSSVGVFTYVRPPRPNVVGHSPSRWPPSCLPELELEVGPSACLICCAPLLTPKRAKCTMAVIGPSACFAAPCPSQRRGGGNQLGPSRSRATFVSKLGVPTGKGLRWFATTERKGWWVPDALSQLSRARRTSEVAERGEGEGGGHPRAGGRGVGGLDSVAGPADEGQPRHLPAPVPRRPLLPRVPRARRPQRGGEGGLPPQPPMGGWKPRVPFARNRLPVMCSN